jgi:hypothetical protein
MRRRGIEILDSGRRHTLGRAGDTYYVWEKRKPKNLVAHDWEGSARQEFWRLEEQALVTRRRRRTKVGVVLGLLCAYALAVAVVLYVNDGSRSVSGPVPMQVEPRGTVAGGRSLNPEGGFSFRAPAGWLVEEAGPTTEIASPDGTVSVSMTAAPDGNLDEATASFVEDLLTAWSDAETEPAHSRTVGTLPALSVSGTAADQAGERIRFVAVVVDSGERNHAISVSVPEAWDAVAFMPAVDELLSSFSPVEAN